MENKKIEEINSKQDALSFLFSNLNLFLSTNPFTPILHIFDLIEKDQKNLITIQKQFQEKIKKFDYTPKNNEINLLIGIHFILQSTEDFKDKIIERSMDAKDEKYVNDYSKVSH